MKKLQVLIFAAILSITLSPAQDQGIGTVSETFKNVSFQDFVRKVENQTGCKIFYDPVQLDTLDVNASFKSDPLSEVFKTVFEGTKFLFYFYESDVYILYDQIIQTELPSDFLSIKSDEDTVSKEILIDFNPNTDTHKKPISIGTKSNKIQVGSATIRGRITEKKTGLPILGVSIFVKELSIGSSSDANGRFAIELPRGMAKLGVTSIGMESIEHDIILYSDGILNFEMEESAISLDELVVEAERDINILEPRMGVTRINTRSIKLVPSALGEADIVGVLLTLPGVKSVGEASNGFNVRGGSSDQNLVLYNESTIYNQSHLFGFFSAFNSDIIQNAQLYKSDIPAEYGGRLSSILKVNSQVGDTTKVSGSGGIGLVTGRFSISAPVAEGTSILLAGRANYSNWILGTIDNEDYQNSRGSFYDGNFDVNHRLNNRNSLRVYGYRSSDSFKLRSDTLYNYTNNAANIKWKHGVNNLFGDLSFGFSNYGYNVSSSSNPVNAFKLSFGIRQLDAKASLNYFKSKHSVNLGVSTVYYFLNSGSLKPVGNESLITNDVLQDERASEKAIFISDNLEVSPKLTVSLGLRYTFFKSKGPRDYFVYADGLPRTSETIVDTLSASRGETIKFYGRPEFRFSSRYTITDESSIKIGINSANQFIHRMSNTIAISPTDIWKLSDSNIKPQSGNQFSIGYFRNFKSGIIETSVEAYYKRIENFLDYKSGAVLIMNPNLEADVINTKGRAYGIEFLIRKTKGRLNGWLGYSYSRSELKQDDILAGELINNGSWYPASFDKPHDLTAITNYKLTNRYGFSLNLTYSTGRPITVPTEQFFYKGTKRLLYSDRNEFRIPDYFRMDVAFNIEGNHKLRKLAHGSWTIAVYNLTGRRNANSVYFLSEKDGVQGYRLSIFGNPIPTITYNFKF